MKTVWRPAVLALLIAVGPACTACSGVPHDRSYQYGVAVMAHIEGEPGTAETVRHKCARELDATPSPFPGYDRSHALRGCLDYDQQINR